MSDPIVAYLAHRFGLEERDITRNGGAYVVKQHDSDGPSVSVCPNWALKLEWGSLTLEVDVSGEPTETVERALAAVHAFNDWKPAEVSDVG